MEQDLYVGIMSGTSLDGIDIALISMKRDTPSTFESIANASFDFDEDLRSDLIKLCQKLSSNLEKLGEIDHKLGLSYSDAVNQFLKQQNLSPNQIKAIGCHGQTVFHHPNGQYPFSMQLGSASVLAAQTNIDVVSNFRAMDMALGGQGAPLVPVFHRELFREYLAIATGDVAILNIGGIANISLLKKEGKDFGYDTGPGNVLMDCWIQQQRNQKYDDNGRWADSGKVNQELLAGLLQTPYLSLGYPKSTGRELFNAQFIAKNISKFNHIEIEDVQATLLAFTVLTISEQIQQHNVSDVIVCGGGAHNRSLVNQLKEALTANLIISDMLDFDADYIEAMAFAWFAAQNISNQPLKLKKVTGAKAEGIAGQLTKCNI
ncbi:anhydro-N-acetylmuramic acid kinase [Catenovulum sp. SM1970]|uniref:anhydro-N-acetylmuramic acid kinase n=1 Tax=Marinifaba aquimaris TaxID=2741323 RepID=UPI001571F1E9|nr:anhydro-N-acetylmuramic acid kinase [Marinifaba aquimaris]NTS78223.1 anhydro-N-acetylmuramic acid kinase [Marinifaba aquimaris]